MYLSRASNVLDVSTCRVQSSNQAATLIGCSLALAGEKNDYEYTNRHIYIYLSRASNVLDVSTCRVQSSNQAATPLPPQCTTWSGRDSLASVRGGLSV